HGIVDGMSQLAQQLFQMIIQLHDASLWKTSLHLIVGRCAAGNKSPGTEARVQSAYASGLRCGRSHFVLEFNRGDATHGSLCDGAAFSPHPLARRARAVSRSYRRRVFYTRFGRASVRVAYLAPRSGSLACGHDRRLRASDDFFWRAVVPRLAACPMNPPPDRTAEKAPTTNERKERFATLGGIPLKAVYTQEDLAGQNAETSIGVPGEFPYTRGIYPTMYRGRLWTMRQYAGFGTAAQSNERFRYLLGKGQTGLSVAFDLPTQIGHDSDDPRAAGEVGKVGVAIDSLEDMEALFAGIPLDRVTTSMTINATAAILLVLYAAVAKKQGADLRKLSGTVQNDILKEFIARGT